MGNILILTDSCSYVLRMKEYERERRLLERQKRIQKKQGLEFA